MRYFGSWTVVISWYLCCNKDINKRTHMWMVCLALLGVVIVQFVSFQAVVRLPLLARRVVGWWAKLFGKKYFYNTLSGSRGGVVVKALRYKPAGSSPDVVIGIFQSHNPSGRTMALGSTQPLAEMNNRLFSGGRGGRWVSLTTLPQSCVVVMKSGNLKFLEPSGPL
jgi:hypothetical protein